MSTELKYMENVPSDSFFDPQTQYHNNLVIQIVLNRNIILGTVAWGPERK